MKAIGIGMVLLLIVLVVGASAGTVYYVSLQGIAPQQLPNLSSNPTAASQQLKSSTLYQSISQGHLNSAVLAVPSNASSQFNVTYSGKALITANVGGISLPVAVPILVNNQKSNNDSRIWASLTGLPVVGSLNVSVIRIKGTTYLCAPKNPLNKSSASQCSKLQGTNSTSLTLFSLVSLISSNMTFNVNNYYPSQYNQVPCIFMNSTVAVQQSQSSIYNLGSSGSGSGYMQSCLSPQNNLPVTLAIGFNSNSKNATVSSISLTLVQSATSNIVSDAAIKTLPAPITS